MGKIEQNLMTRNRAIIIVSFPYKTGLKVGRGASLFRNSFAPLSHWEVRHNSRSD